MHGIAVSLGVLLLLSSSARGDAPPSEPVAVDLLSARGTGCPEGSVDIEMSPDNTWFRIWHRSDYVARVGLGAAPTDFRRNCQVLLLIRAPQGMTYAVAAVDHQAFVSLAPGASARYRATLSFAGRQATMLAHTISDPEQDQWRANDTFAENTLLFAFCNLQPAFTVSTDLVVRSGTSDPTTTMSSVSLVGSDDVGRGPTVYHLVWRRCA